MLAKAKQLTAASTCAAPSASDEIVVCGRRNDDAYRVPPSSDGGSVGDLRGRAGEVPSASTDRLASGSCGIFAGERRCGKAEMKQYGYGGGRDPASVAFKVGKALIYPD